MSNLVRREESLPSLDKARDLLERSRTTQEVMRIKALAQAVAAVAATERARDEAAAIVLLAKARIGELTAKVEAVPRGGKPGRGKSNRSRTERLEAEGISRKDAAECERIATLKRSGDLDRVIAKGGTRLTSSAAVALAKLPAFDRRKAIAKLGDIPDVGKAIRAVQEASREGNRKQRAEKLATVAKGNAPIEQIAERFPVLYADPPWRYEHAESESRAIENQYPTMALDEIKSLDVAKITTDDAILFLWATSPKLAEAMSVLEAWGFTYRTCMVWDKEKIGMGYYARQQHELLLIATKGSPPTPPPAARPCSVYRESRDPKHSSKPAHFYELIENMYPELPKLEMFCRSPRHGWAAWGNQSGGQAA